MSINDELSALYNKWNQFGHFVPGGVVNEQNYQKSKIKILMLLKEVNDTKQNKWTLVDHLNKQIDNNKYRQIWKNVGTWIYGAQNNFPEYQIAKKNVGEGLSYVATTNLKKTGGKGSSISEEIESYARETKELWTKEITIINPDFVICGGTFPLVKQILDMNAYTAGSGAKAATGLNTTFVDFFHPAYRISPKIMYAYFKETITYIK